MAVVTLNGNNYHATLIKQYTLDPQSPAFRTTGQVQRPDNRKLSFSVYDRHERLGIGWRRMRRSRDDQRGVGGMWKSTSETRFADCVYSGLMEHQETHADPAQHLVRYVPFNGAYVGIFDETYASDELTSSFSRVFGATSDDWTSGGQIDVGLNNADGMRVWDVALHKGKLVALTLRTIGDFEYDLFDTADAVTWAQVAQPDATSATTSAISRRNNFNDDEGRLFDDGTTLWMAVYDRASSGEIKVLTSTNGGTTNVAEVGIPSVDGPKGLLRWFDRSGTSSILIGTAEGLYTIDASANTFTLEYALDGQSTNCRWMIVGDDGNMYVPLADGDLLKFSLTSTGNGWVIDRIGPQTAHDGLPAEWQGNANYLMTGNSLGGAPSPWLWVAYGGNASSKTATIMCYHYKDSGEQGFPVWHCFHDAEENSISGMGQNVDITQLGLSSQDDGRMRLHATAEGSTASLNFHFEDPLVCHVASNVTGKYIASTFVRYAEDDHGDPHSQGALYIGRLDQAELDTTNEYISHYYSVNGVEPPVTDLGDYNNTVIELTYASKAGISARTSMHELRLIRDSGDTAERAVYRAFDIGYAKQLVSLTGWQLSVDLEKSAELLTTTPKTAEQVITNLETVRDSAVQVQWEVGAATATFVHMLPGEISWELETVEPGGGTGATLGRRIGTATFVLEERL